MRSLGGVILLAGIGVGLFVYLPAPVDQSTSLQQATRVSQEERAPEPVPSRLVAFAPSVPLPAMPKRAENLGYARPALAELDHATARDGGLNGWQTVVASSSSGPMTASLQPTDPDSRYKLVVELQENLKRLGCYWGRIDGSWGPGSKHAMQTFAERVNATLPTDRPDYVLLTLLRGHDGNTCGEAETTVAETSTQGTTQVATTSEETLPWKDAGQPVFKPIANSVISSEALPGRMAIGGPKALPPVNQTYNAADPYAAQPSGNVATAALEPGDAPPPQAATPRKRKTAKKAYKRRYRRNGPGTPRYNLMLSLGGVY